MSATMKLYYVLLDDGCFLNTWSAHQYHAHYFTDASVARYAGDGFAKTIFAEYGFHITFEIKCQELPVRDALTLLLHHAARDHA